MIMKNSVQNRLNNGKNQPEMLKFMMQPKELIEMLKDFLDNVLLNKNGKNALLLDKKTENC